MPTANLKESQAIQESSNVVDDLTPSDEDVASSVIHDEIEVALAISRFLVFEAEVTSWELM